MSKSKVALFLAACIITAISSGSSRAQECRLLQDTIDTGSSSKLRTAHFHKACTQSYEEFDRSWGAKAKGEYLGIGGSGEYNKKNYRKWFENKCTEIKNEEHRSASYYLSQRFLSNNALEAYKACLNQYATLVCLAEPNGEDIDFLISWNEKGSLGKLTGIALRDGHVFGPSLEFGATIRRGNFRLTVIPNKPEVPVRLTLNIAYGVGEEATVSCRAYAVVRPLVINLPKSRSKVIVQNSSHQTEMGTFPCGGVFNDPSRSVDHFSTRPLTSPTWSKNLLERHITKGQSRGVVVPLRGNCKHEVQVKLDNGDVYRKDLDLCLNANLVVFRKSLCVDYE